MITAILAFIRYLAVVKKDKARMLVIFSCEEKDRTSVSRGRYDPLTSITPKKKT